MTSRARLFLLLIGVFLVASLAAFSGCGGSPAVSSPAAPGSGTLALAASTTLTPEQATQPEQIFLYSFPLPPGQQNFVALNGQVSLTSQEAVFNESLISVATNTTGTCPANGSVFPNYTAISNAFPNLFAIQEFILKNPVRGTSKVSVDYTMPIALPVSDCMVVMLDWEGGSAVTMSSNLSLTYTSASTPPAGMLLGTNQEFVFGDNQGPGSTGNDSLSFVQETIVPQPGTIVGFVGDISDSSFFVAPPPGQWTTTNDIYLVPGGCPSDMPVNSSGYTSQAGDYYAMLPANSQHLLSVPLSGSGTAVAEQFVYQSAKLSVQTGDCLLTLFGLKAPQGGGIDSENQVQSMFLPGS